MSELTRRDFLKLGGLGLLASLRSGPSALVCGTGASGVPTTPGARHHGNAWVYDTALRQRQPRQALLARPAVVPITMSPRSKRTSSLQPHLVQARPEGYAYSGGMQPVRTLLNRPGLAWPQGGLLGEVSVPFTDAPKARSRLRR